MNRYLKDLVERALRATATAALTVVTLAQFNILDISSWKQVLAASALACLISVLTSVAAGFRGSPESASLSRDVAPKE